MDKQPLFYKKPVPLNKDIHGKLYMEPLASYEFASGTNSVYLAAIEFFKAARDYPIVFGKSEDGEVFPAVLFGLQYNENLFLDDEYHWLADYIPAYVRRYPFILATNETVGSFAVCIDEEYSGFNTNKKGEALYDDTGEKTPVLQKAMEFLRDYQSHILTTSKFCSALDSMGILEPMEAKILKEGNEKAISGFYCINRETLKGLSPKQMQELMLNDYMDLIFTHLYSLNNLSRFSR